MKLLFEIMYFNYIIKMFGERFNNNAIKNNNKPIKTVFLKTYYVPGAVLYVMFNLAFKTTL